MTDDDDWIGPWPAGALPVTSNHWPRLKGHRMTQSDPDDELVRRLRSPETIWRDAIEAAARIEVLRAERDAAVAELAALRAREAWRPIAEALTDLLTQLDVSDAYAREDNSGSVPTVWQLQNGHLRSYADKIASLIPSPPPAEDGR